MSDKRFGTIHGHAHVRVAPVDVCRPLPPILPRYASLYNPDVGANLRFRDVTLEASRKRGIVTAAGRELNYENADLGFDPGRLFPSLNEAQTARHSRQQNAIPTNRK